MDKAGHVAAAGASMTVDVMGQAGVGHQGYFDTTPQPRRGTPTSSPRTRVGHGWDTHSGNGGQPGADHPHDTSPGTAHDPAHINTHPAAPATSAQEAGHQGAGPVGGGPVGGGGDAAGAAGDGAFIA